MIVSSRTCGRRCTQVVGALNLRRWALAVLAGRRADPVFGGDDTSFRLFFEAERCAVQLTRRFHDEDVGITVPGEIQSRVAAQTERETARIRSARTQLAVVAQIVLQHGWRVAVLKGAVVAMSDQSAVDLVDIDLLAAPEDAARLAEQLSLQEYRPVGHSSPRHLTGSAKDDGIPIEIHTTLARDGASLPSAFWDRVVPLETVPGLYRLRPKDHLWHLLEHVAIDHPERRGFVRELMLISSAIAECTENDVAMVRRLIEKHALRTRLRELFSTARAFGEGRSTGDRLQRVAAAFYAVRLLLLDASLRESLQGYVYQWAFAVQSGQHERRRLPGERSKR